MQMVDDIAQRPEHGPRQLWTFNKSKATIAAIHLPARF